MIPTIKGSILGASLLLVAATAASAATLAVDINGGGTIVTETGFTGYTATVAGALQTTFAYTDTSNGTDVTFTVTGLNGDNNRERGAIADNGVFTYGDLYRDILFDNATGGADAFDITFSGLVANAAYSFKFYAFDNNQSDGHTNTFTLNTAGATFNAIFIDTSGATGGTGVITDAGTPTTNSQYALTLAGTTNNLGNISFTQTGSAYPVLNGFEITPVPEPSSAMALVSSIALLLGIRRRRTA